MSASLTSEDILKLVYQVDIDLFLASLLALVSTFCVWMKMTASFIPVTFCPLLLWFVWALSLDGYAPVLVLHVVTPQGY